MTQYLQLGDPSSQAPLAPCCVVTEGGDEAGAGEGVAPPDDEAAGGRAVGRAGLGVAGRDTVGVARQPAWARVPSKEKAGAGV